VDLADLLLLDIKALDPDLCTTMTGADGSGAKALLDLRQEQGRPVWLRHVLVPGYTLDMEKLTVLADYLAPYTCIERVELLPFHQLGKHKWETLGIPYELAETVSPPAAQVEQARDIFRARGFTVY
jgi:pyruvate formate lyase activating enzyme